MPRTVAVGTYSYGVCHSPWQIPGTELLQFFNGTISTNHTATGPNAMNIIITSYVQSFDSCGGYRYDSPHDYFSC